MSTSIDVRFEDVSAVNLDLAGALEALLEEASLTIDCDDDSLHLWERFLVWEDVTGLVELGDGRSSRTRPPPLPSDA